MQADGTELPLFDSSAPDGLTTFGYANFLLQGVQEARMEKSQIVETFGDSYIFFFGENPRFLDVEAVLLNTHDFNWRAEWWANYHEYLRGTKLVELGARIYMFYDDVIVEGYMMNAAAQETSQQPYTVQMTFRLFVTNYSNISFVEPPANAMYPIRSSVQLPQGVELTSSDASRRIQTAARATQLAALPGDTITDAVRDRMNSVGYPEAIYQLYGYVPERFISELVVPQGVYDTDTQPTDIPGAGGTDLVFRDGIPLRGKIAENLDEYAGLLNSYAGSPLDKYSGIPSAMQSTVRSMEEVDDLFRESIQFLTCYGANINSPDLVFKLGLGPNFKPKVSVQDSTSFSPIGTEEASLSDWYDKKKEQITNSWDQFQEDPLSLVYGKPKESTFQNRSKYTQGAGDPLYGYPSDFADSQPGFGVSGFGDFGGFGFGSGQGGGGDPGFKDPSKFTFAGVANAGAAFDQFLETKEDNTVFSLNAGASLGTSGLSGGAVTEVNGAPTAFALISVPGILDSGGNARSSAEAIAERQAQQKFGFSVDNPYGVDCPTSDSTFRLSIP